MSALNIDESEPVNKKVRLNDERKQSKFEVSNIKILSAWCYDLKSNQDCTICRCNLNCNSIYANEKGTESTILSGICNHTFHKECITSWIKINSVCPICFIKWTSA